MVAERIVNFLEFIQIDKDQREGGAGALGAGQYLCQTILEQVTIGQTRQRVVMRQICPALFGAQ